MKSTLRGLRFIVYTTILKNSKAGWAYNLPLPNKEIPLLLYPPKGKEKGLIITFTGFSVNGYQDRRMMVVSNAFSKLGYRVITPRINTIDELQIHPQAIDEIKECIQALAVNINFNPEQSRPAVFAPSFTAGISGLAIAQLPPNTVSSLCMLGSFCDFESTLEFAIANKDNADDYGMHILMKNFVKYELAGYSGLEQLIQTAIEDNGMNRPKPLLPEMLAQVPPETAALYKRLKQDAAYRKQMILDAWRNSADFVQWKNQLDLSLHAHAISCPVSVIHAQYDQVIPAEQSGRLSGLLNKNNKHVNLEISTLLDHGAVKLSFALLSKVLRLAGAMGYFMQFIRADTRNNGKNLGQVL